MEYRRLGSSGLKVSALSLGCNAFGSRADAATATTLVHAAMDAGINLFDTANTYSKGVSEQMVGAALKDRRSRAVLATKVCWEMGSGPNDRGLSRQHIVDEVDASLRRLQTDYIDLYQMHFFDPEAPLEESLRALEDLVRWGKVRYLGCSNFTGWQIMKSLWIQDRRGYAPLVCSQSEYSPANRRIERDVLPACMAEGLGMLTFFPLGAGAFTGKYQPDAPPPPGSRALVAAPLMTRWLNPATFQLIAGLQVIADQAGVTLPNLVLAWNMQRPGITSTITGATKLEQLQANLKACDVQLPADVIAAVDAASADRA